MKGSHLTPSISGNGGTGSNVEKSREGESFGRVNGMKRAQGQEMLGLVVSLICCLFWEEVIHPLTALRFPTVLAVPTHLVDFCADDVFRSAVVLTNGREWFVSGLRSPALSAKDSWRTASASHIRHSGLGFHVETLQGDGALTSVLVCCRALAGSVAERVYRSLMRKATTAGRMSSDAIAQIQNSRE